MCDVSLWFGLCVCVRVFVSMLERGLLCRDMFTFLKLWKTGGVAPSLFLSPFIFSFFPPISRFLCLCGWTALSHIHRLPTPAVMMVTDREFTERKTDRGEDKLRLSRLRFASCWFVDRVNDRFMYVYVCGCVYVLWGSECMDMQTRIWLLGKGKIQSVLLELGWRHFQMWNRSLFTHSHCFQTCMNHLFCEKQKVFWRI